MRASATRGPAPDDGTPEPRQTADGQRAGERLAQWTRALCVLFFFSGFPALIYQLTWQRALFRIFGVNIESVTIVVTAFMLGLGLGSLAGGWLSKRRGIPLLPLLAAIELATGAFGLASLAIFDQVGRPRARPVAAADGGRHLGARHRADAADGRDAAGAGRPSGAPLWQCRQRGRTSLLRQHARRRRRLPRLHAAALSRSSGMQGAIYVAVAINGAVAVGALVMHWHDRRGAWFATVAPSTIVRAPALGLAAVLVLAAAGGFVSLSYEIFFFRIVSYASGSSATAFAATLSAFLVGLASGSRQAGRNCEHFSREEMMRRAASGLMKANLLGPRAPAAPQPSRLARPRRHRRRHAHGLSRGAILGLAAALSRRARHQGRRPCRACALRCSISPISSVRRAGSILTGFVLMDHLSFIAIATALVVCGSLLPGSNVGDARYAALAEVGYAPASPPPSAPRRC